MVQLFHVWGREEEEKAWRMFKRNRPSGRVLRWWWWGYRVKIGR